MLHNSVFLTIILALILNSIRLKSRATRDALWKKVFLEISQNSIKKRLWHRCFPVNFVKFLKTRFYRTPLDDCDLMSKFLGLHSDYFQLQSKSIIVHVCITPLRISSVNVSCLLKKSLMENFIFCAVIKQELM